MPKSDYLPGDHFGFHSSVMIHRLANLAPNTLNIGKYTRVDAFVTITGNVSIGERVHVATGACLLGGFGIVMEDGSGISPGAKIFTAGDDPSQDSLSNPALVYRRMRKGPVYVGFFASIGANSCVLPGASLGDESQIGCCSVVPAGMLVPPSEVWGGVPIHYIKRRVPIDRGAAMGHTPKLLTGA